MKKPWLASLLNVLPGLGYLYINSKRLLGWLLLVGYVALIISNFDPSLNLSGPGPQGIWILWNALFLVLPIIGFITDGYLEAKRMNKLLSKGKTNVAQEDIRNKNTWKTPSTTKLILLSLVTLGIYQLYVSWRLWEIVQRSKGNVNKFEITFFAIFMSISNFWLFPRITVLAQKDDHKNNVDYAAIYFATGIIFGLLIRITNSSPYSLLLYPVSDAVMAFILLPIINIASLIQIHKESL